MPETDLLTTRFATQHSVDLRHLPDPECDLIRWFLRCTDALDRDYQALPEHILASDPAVGVIWQLLARSAEMAEAAIVAFATASGAATEVLSRAAIERAVSIGFIVVEPATRVAAYIRHHVDSVDRQVARWRAEAVLLPEEGRRIHVEACEHRSVANRHLRAFVDRLESELIGSNPRVTWPTKIEDLFGGLRDRLTYRTAYARLCSETHFDAEETLRYIQGKVAGDAMMQRMALETIGFTRMMLAIAVAYHLKAIGAYASRYEMRHTIRTCSEGVARVDQLTMELSEHVGGV